MSSRQGQKVHIASKLRTRTKSDADDDAAAVQTGNEDDANGDSAGAPKTDEVDRLM